MKCYCLISKTDFDGLLPQEKREIVAVSNSPSFDQFPKVTLSGRDFLIIETTGKPSYNNFLKTCDFFHKTELLKVLESGMYYPEEATSSIPMWRAPLEISPFSSKKINGRNVVKRVHGIRGDATQGANSVLFEIPYPLCILTGVEFLNAEDGEYCDLSILDTLTGSLTGIPSHELNQFGFGVNISKGFYAHTAEYGANLTIGVQIRLLYFSKSVKPFAVNYILNEIV